MTQVYYSADEASGIRFKSRIISLNRVSNQAHEILVSIGNRGFIAGGYARWALDKANSPKPTDIDVFHCNTDLHMEPVDTDKFEFTGYIIARLRNLGYVAGRRLPNALEMTHSLKHYKPVQLIVPFQNQYMLTYGTPQEVMGQFDFPVAMAALQYRDEGFWATWAACEKADFFKDNKAHILHINHINCPLAVSLRVLKHMPKGYRIGAREMVKLFVEWENRPEHWKSRLVSLIQNDDLPPEDWWELERLLRID